MMPTLTLASASPRRRQLLEMLHLPIRVVPSDVQEIPLPRETPAAYSRRLARDKARAVPGQLVLGADTIVVLDDEILEKPSDAEHAVAMLQRLQGRRHTVITSICLIADGRELEAADETVVVFREADEAYLRAYVATGEPMDKAGAYAIQGGGGAFVDHIEGRRDTVIGLDLASTRRLLRMAGVTVPCHPESPEGLAATPAE